MPTDSAHPDGRTREAINIGGVKIGVRQAEVLLLVCDGLDRNEIAIKLGVVAKTIDHHIAKARNDTGLRSSLALTRAALAD